MCDYLYVMILKHDMEGELNVCLLDVKYTQIYVLYQ